MTSNEATRDMVLRAQVARDMAGKLMPGAIRVPVMWEHNDHGVGAAWKPIIEFKDDSNNPQHRRWVEQVKGQQP